MKLERDEVVRTAIRLLDEVGLDALSLRRLARELGVQAPALYWHFANKQELLDEMVSMMAAGSRRRETPAPGQSWDDWLTALARDLHAGYRAHRDAVRLAAGSRPTADRAPAIEGMLRALCDAGFTPGEALLNILALTDYVGGAALEEQAGRDREDDGLERLQGAPSGEGLLGRAVAEIQSPGAAFEHGLGLLIDGMRARLAASGRRPSPSSGHRGPAAPA
ncbi:TetR/AcrR family transcriptional regulator C-terminal domain-containing protein [Actinomadura violacea]|uniref:TetR/AcrR family transcriptional regulator C-terminal domain-containing protein n=1 Tax=Actinomadura violacea TaxID=2819934 RepID=A0ABS3RXF4_9ACTN|nr:TetR/AcrR family transcriptional regulator C-terminal domain-containing protein [Actinomadura violacea]MBO2461331.1 TetR/AcrR family transcriptional regulator C-terminal domain-containing protein [Actinomadura violacea]